MKKSKLIGAMLLGTMAGTLTSTSVMAAGASKQDVKNYLSAYRFQLDQIQSYPSDQNPGEKAMFKKTSGLTSVNARNDLTIAKTLAQAIQNSLLDTCCWNPSGIGAGYSDFYQSRGYVLLN